MKFAVTRGYQYNSRAMGIKILADFVATNSCFSYGSSNNRSNQMSCFRTETNCLQGSRKNVPSAPCTMVALYTWVDTSEGLSEEATRFMVSVV